jgi:cell shape-determining protein MreC
MLIVSGHRLLGGMIVGHSSVRLLCVLYMAFSILTSSVSSFVSMDRRAVFSTLSYVERNLNGCPNNVAMCDSGVLTCKLLNRIRTRPIVVRNEGQRQANLQLLIKQSVVVEM